MAVKRMNVKVSEEMHAWLQQQAESRGLTMNAVIIFALETYYNQQQVLPHLDGLMKEHERQERLKKELE